MTYILVLKKTLPSETIIIKLTFKEYNETLPDNFNISKIRLNNLKTRLNKKRKFND